MSNEEMLREHRATYGSFTKLVFFSTVFIVITLALMAIFLV